MNPLRKILLGSAIAGATLVGGALGASLVGVAGAESGGTPAATVTSTLATTDSGTHGTEAPGGQHDPSQGGHTANGKTEALLTGTDKTKAESAATAAVKGGTIERSETDAEGAAFEVHMTKTDGSHVTVKLDAAFKVTGIEDGHP